MDKVRPLILFDIDGTLVSKTGGSHRRALEESTAHFCGRSVTLEHVNTHGRLDHELIATMLEDAGAVCDNLDAIYRRAEELFDQYCPDIRHRVCPGVEPLLERLSRQGVVLGLVTGNLPRIAYRKLAQAGIGHYFSFGAFAGEGRTRGDLAGKAHQHALAQGLATAQSRVSLIGDHPNDVRAALENGFQSIAVATGGASIEELEAHGAHIVVRDLTQLPLEVLL